MRPNFKLFTQKSHFGFEVKMMPKENIQQFRSVGAWNVSFCTQVACRLTPGQSGRTRGLQIKTERSFSMMQDFGQSSLKLSAFHKLVKCYGNLQDKFQLTKWVFLILEEE